LFKTFWFATAKTVVAHTNCQFVKNSPDMICKPIAFVKMIV